MKREYPINPSLTEGDVRRAEAFGVAGEEHDDDEEPEESPKDRQKRELLEKARGEWAEFGKIHEGTINAYFGTPDVYFTMKPGGWYIMLEAKPPQVNADPTFFLEKGYTESEALFATFHEAEHFHDMIQDADAYELLFHKINQKTEVHKAYPKALHRFYNCLDDIVVNKSVMAKWKAGRKAKDMLYPKLFPSDDALGGQAASYCGQPRHRQFMYYLLRKQMLPNEEIIVDPEVQEEIDKWEARAGGQATSVMTAVDVRGRAKFAPRARYARFEVLLEPIFEEFYKWDLENWDPPEGKGDKGGKGESEESGDDPFGDDPNQDAIPDPMDYKDAADAAKKISDKANDKKADKFKEVMGVEKRDFESYQRDLAKIEEHKDELSAVWDEVIQRRKSYRRVLRKPVKEGPVVNPSRLAPAIAGIKSGQLEQEMFLDFEKKEVIRQQPNRVEFTLVGDGSGSMKGNKKEIMQRRLAVLAMESFADFQSRVEKERRRGEKINLEVHSEARIFSEKDEVVKPLSTSLTHVDRVRMHKRLKNLPGQGNQEDKTFDAINDEQFTQERIAALHKGDVIKVIVFLTDGDTAVNVQKKMAELQIQARDPKTGKSNLVIAAIGFDEGTKVPVTYAPHGHYANTLDDVPRIFQKIIAQVMEAV